MQNSREDLKLERKIYCDLSAVSCAYFKDVGSYVSWTELKKIDRNGVDFGSVDLYIADLRHLEELTFV